jgi:hypothetical protein
MKADTFFVIRTSDMFILLDVFFMMDAVNARQQDYYEGKKSALCT